MLNVVLRNFSNAALWHSIRVNAAVDNDARKAREVLARLGLHPGDQHLDKTGPGICIHIYIYMYICAIFVVYMKSVYLI